MVNIDGKTINKQDIITAIFKQKSALSALGIIDYLDIDLTSEAIREIKDICFGLVDKGDLIPIDRRKDDMGLFFDLKTNYAS